MSCIVCCGKKHQKPRIVQVRSEFRSGTALGSAAIATRTSVNDQFVMCPATQFRSPSERAASLTEGEFPRNLFVR